ncbi:unnamed protein product [Musa textilis]
MRHSTLAKKGLVIINMGFLIGKDDPTVGHPLYCEIRQVEVKKVKATGSPFASYIFQRENCCNQLG